MNRPKALTDEANRRKRVLRSGRRARVEKRRDVPIDAGFGGAGFGHLGSGGRGAGRDLGRRGREPGRDVVAGGHVVPVGSGATRTRGRETRGARPLRPRGRGEWPDDGGGGGGVSVLPRGFRGDGGGGRKTSGTGTRNPPPPPPQIPTPSLRSGSRRLPGPAGPLVHNPSRHPARPSRAPTLHQI